MGVRDIEGARRAPAAERAGEVSRSLREAESLAAADEASLRVDREVVEMISSSEARDAVIEEVDLERLAGLLERCAERLADGEAQAGARDLAWSVLDLVRRPALLSRIYGAGAVDEWADRILSVVEASNFTVGPLFRQRARAYTDRVLFHVPSRRGGEELTWRQVAVRVERLARGLLALDHPDEPGRIAILSENGLEMALLDMACLTSGIVNVMVPANSTDSDVGYILKHARARTVVVSGREQLDKVEKNYADLPELRRVIVVERVGSVDDSSMDVMSLRDVEDRAGEVPGEIIDRRSDAVRIDDLATVMYTSGTTGMPKGIQYSHRNIVFKRFARALALPEIGDDDVFLAYLPLFHTFGRYLDLWGSVFWGARYCFLLNTSVEALIEGMRRHRPTVFISVPRKWIQLYEAIAKKADPLSASDEELKRATDRLTGGRLRWGLSAAGHLDPDIFRFFHKQGIELLSGFGMSEATGGITMTPPGEYRENSLGVALPGIEMKLADDGELLIRGPYVMIGYLDPPDDEPSFDEEGWLHSGDLMRMDDEDHIRLVDRKKEIYKNVKGQTIAPQRIENLFREFESVGRVFLVGDHREYNTLLIYPNPDYEELDFSGMTAAEVRDHFRSLVVSVNKFVSPFERIVDFAIIDRDLDADKGELTPKGTPRRSVVAENFADVIESLYVRTEVEIGGAVLTLPNWLFQTLGVTAQDVRITGDRISLPSISTHLRARRLAESEVQVGSSIYRFGGRALNLGALLATPRLWLGNDELVAFAPLELDDRQRPGRSAEAIEWLRPAERFDPKGTDREVLEEAARRADWDLLDLHHAAQILSSRDEESALSAVRLLERVLISHEEGPLAEPCLQVLARGVESPSQAVRRRALEVLVPLERVTRFRETVERFLLRDPSLLDAETRAVLCERSLPESKLEALIDLAWSPCTGSRAEPNAEELAGALMRFLAEYGAAHPIRYRRIRAFLVRVSLFAHSEGLRELARDARETLKAGFLQWLGPTIRIAVDTETGQEYRWDDVVVFEEGAEEDNRRRLLSAIKNTPFLREGVFLLYGSKMIHLTDIPPGGVWIRPLGRRHGKSVYRITIQTRAQDSYELAANMNESLPEEQVWEEIDWLILCGDSYDREPVVEDFGGYTPEEDLWSEEFISGDTLDREMRRLSRRSTDGEGLAQLWPFLAWSALSAYVDFWERTGRRCEMADLSPTDIVLPTHDYHRGSRIISLSARREHRGLIDMLRSFREKFIAPVEAEYPELAGIVGWDVVFSSVLEILGEQEGLSAYEEALSSDSSAPEDLRKALREYVTNVRSRGFLPMRLYFAAKRYRRWARLNEDATPQARARTLKEFYDTYGLDRLASSYPEARLRFFRETVFRDGSPEIVQGLDDLIRRVRSGEMREGELAGAIADLRLRLKVEPEDDYFLARIPFAYLKPEDSVDFVRRDLGGEYQSEIVVTLEDLDGNIFRVRHALLPKEVERLHRLFVAAKLDVRFGPEHRYLVAINDREQIIGGIYYTVEESGASAHLEKIVVAEPYRRKGVAGGLMRELFNRLRAAGIKTLTTGFFRPEYFYSYGFKIERRYAGLVKELEEEPVGAGAG